MKVIIDLIEHSIFLTRFQKYRLIDLCEKYPEKISSLQKLLVKWEEIELQSEAIYSPIESKQQAQYVFHQNENEVIQMQIMIRKMISKYV